MLQAVFISGEPNGKTKREKPNGKGNRQKAGLAPLPCMTQKPGASLIKSHQARLIPSHLSLEVGKKHRLGPSRTTPWSPPMVSQGEVQQDRKRVKTGGQKAPRQSPLTEVTVVEEERGCTLARQAKERNQTMELPSFEKVRRVGSLIEVKPPRRVWFHARTRTRTRALHCRL